MSNEGRCDGSGLVETGTESTKVDRWKSGVVRPALRGDVFNRFGIYYASGSGHNVTHLQSGFKGHETLDVHEARRVAQAFEELGEAWDAVQLSPDGSMTVIGMTPELSDAAGRARNRALGKEGAFL